MLTIDNQRELERLARQYHEAPKYQKRRFVGCAQLHLDRLPLRESEKRELWQRTLERVRTDIGAGR